MARPLRIEFSGGCYHVINRGNYRRRIFEGKGAADSFERTLDEAARRFQWRIHAYVIMGNHFHLGVELTEPNLSEGMKWLQGTWIRRYNGFRKLVGRPFQGRYKALIVEPGHPFGQVCHYIHLNPVRAKLVPAERAPEYRWSSLRGFAGKGRPEWLDATTVLEDAGGLKDTRVGWRKYGEYLEFLATDETSQKELIAKRMSRGWCLGSKEFKTEMRKEASERGASLDRVRFEGLEKDEARAEREAFWEERLVDAAELVGVDLEDLPARKSAPGKCLLAAVMKECTSVSNGWLAKRLDMGQPASASQYARRWMLGEKQARKVRKLCKKLQGSESKNGR